MNETSSLHIITQYFADFTPAQLQQLQALENLYAEWNEKINVISRKDIGSLYEKHVLHSLAIAAVFDFKPGMRVIDIGAGGGFPSIPLAIFFPETAFLAADSINKKLTVVQAVAEGAGIKNISTRHTRAEDIKDQKFDVAVSRAVAPLKDLLKWSKHLLKTPAQVMQQFGAATEDDDLRTPAGLICFKGGDLSQEIAESNRRPHSWELSALFSEPWFEQKYLLQVA